MNKPERLNPGQHRCPGPSTRDIIKRDNDHAPEHLLDESYQFMGDGDIDYKRYTSQAFFDDEMRYFWPRIWQWACREDEIPEPGDYTVYDIGDYSAIVLRDNNGEVRAYANACLHRGTQLKESGSSGYSQQLRCPFHGFSWSLEGNLTDMPCDWDFPHVDQDEFNLPQIKTSLWGGFVFINFDPDATSLEEYLEVIPDHFENWDLSKKFTAKHIRKKLPANWKACYEAFLESFHVLETHPQGVTTVGDANTQYDVYGDHVSRFVHLVGYPSPHLKESFSEQQILDALLGEGVVDQAKDLAEGLTVKEGETAREVFARHLQKTMGAAYRRDFSQLSVTETIDAIEYALLPNTCLFPSLLFPMVYRFRPDGKNPDSTIFDLVFLQPFPDDGDIPEPADPVELDYFESFQTVPGFDPGLAEIYDQDTGNLAAQQRGFKSSIKPGQTLGNYQEIRIRHLHQTIDKYLNAGKARQAGEKS